MHSTGLVADDRVTKHDAGRGHPEQPARYAAILNRFEQSGLLQILKRVESRDASDDDLALVHTRLYIDLVRREIGQHRNQLSTGDTDIGVHSLEAAQIAAGSVLSAVDAVFSGSVRNAFCVVRPPGHHASAATGMGFCFFNNVAIGARYAQQHYGIERVLIADWDVHHGNGTQDIFYRDGSVLFFSTHQSPWYPGTGAASETGEGRGAGKTINCPFPAGSGSREVLGAFREILLPAANTLHPEFVLISAGFDSRIGDPLGHFLLTDADFAELTRMMTDLADTHCAGRLVSVLEGGYSLQGLANAAESHARCLIRDYRL